jgi:hypothetical protein
MKRRDLYELQDRLAAKWTTTLKHADKPTAWRDIEIECRVWTEAIPLGVAMNEEAEEVIEELHFMAAIARAHSARTDIPF